MRSRIVFPLLLCMISCEKHVILFGSEQKKTLLIIWVYTTRYMLPVPMSFSCSWPCASLLLPIDALPVYTLLSPASWGPLLHCIHKQLCSSTNEAEGDRFFTGCPGVYLHCDRLWFKANHCVRWIPMCGDGLF